MKKPKPISFIDVQAHRARIGDAIDEAIAKVVSHGEYILGPEVIELEATLSVRMDGRHVITCANGTDALHLCLRGLGAKRNDAVFVPAFTFAATAEAICLAGATPVFVDIDSDTYNISIESLDAAIRMVRDDGALNPVGVIAVDLFGQSATYSSLELLTKKHGIWLLEDAAQALGARFNGKPCGTFGIAATTSFFPAKPLGAYGDGGAIFVEDAALAAQLRSLRMHGKGTDKYDNIHIGTNSRLDTVQAAILLEKLKVFDDEIEARNKVALRYNELLKDIVTTPTIHAEKHNVWAQYTIRTPLREQLKAALKEAGIPTAIYYRSSLTQQPAYEDFPVAPTGVRASNTAAAEVLSLPMHAYLSETLQDRIVDEIKAFFGPIVGRSIE